MNNIVIDTYKDGDEIGINNLFNSVFNQNRDLKEWEWKFMESPINSRPFVILAKDGEKIVGQYSCIAFYLKYRDTIVRSVQPVDNFVDEDYRGGAKGIQVQMFLKLEEALRNNGIDMGFGFPNREAYIVGKRLLKYVDLIKIENFFKRLSWRLALKKRANIPLLIDFLGWMSRFLIRFSIAIQKKPIRGIQYRWLRDLDARIDSFWEKISEQYGIMVKRDFTYLNWRYCKKPGRDYHILQAEKDGNIVGITIVKYEDREDARIGFIMECIAVKEPYLMENLVRRGLIFLLQNKVDYVLCRLSSGDSIRSIFNKIGFAPKEGIWDSNVVYKIYSSKVDDSILKDPSMWHISFGDCDSL
jgi:hypothetical protein